MNIRNLAALVLGALLANTTFADEGLKTWIESSIPAMMRGATPDTLFGIGSITKSFVAISILQLAAQGKLDLDDPVSKHIPFELGLPGRPITIRHFLTHSPGFPSLATSSVLLRRGLGAGTGVPMSDSFRGAGCYTSSAMTI